MIIKTDLLSNFSFYVEDKKLVIHFFDEDLAVEHSEKVDLTDLIKLVELLLEEKSND